MRDRLVCRSLAVLRRLRTGGLPKSSAPVKVGRAVPSAPREFAETRTLPTPSDAGGAVGTPPPTIALLGQQARSFTRMACSRTAALWLLAAMPGLVWAAEKPPGYVVVVAEPTQADPAWSEVVAALVAKHHATVLAFDSAVTNALPELRRQFPRYVCFVAKPCEVTREFVTQVNRLTRHLDDDPYTDCFWGILTGYDAAAALRIARLQEPLTIRKVAAGTDIALPLCEQGTWYCELQKNRMVRKEPGQAAVELRGPDDTTKVLVDLLNDYHADLFVTSGHATEHDCGEHDGQFRGSIRPVVDGDGDWHARVVE